MVFNPSSIVKTAPHFGHFTFVSLLAIPWHPKENTAKKANANTKLVTFFIPLHLLSFVKYFQKKTGTKNLRPPDNNRDEETIKISSPSWRKNKFNKS